MSLACFELRRVGFGVVEVRRGNVIGPQTDRAQNQWARRAGLRFVPP
jgi:hypothetical protein